MQFSNNGLPDKMIFANHNVYVHELLQYVLLHLCSKKQHLERIILTWCTVEMALLRHFLIFFMIIVSTYCRPPRQKVTEHHETPQVKQGDHAPAGNGSEQWDLGIEYNRYLQEVVQVLESDPEFRKKLEDSDVEKIRDGSIAEELKFVDHNLRTKLDDVKRKEVDRLR